MDSPLLGLKRIEGAPHEELRRATRRAFERMIDLCLEEEADLLLFAGDLFDHDARDYNTSLFVVRQFARLRESKTQVVLVKGNHDADSVITKNLNWPDNVFEFGSKKAQTKHFPDLGVAVHGQSFANRSVTDNLALGFPSRISDALNIGLLHTNATQTDEHDSYAPCTPDQLTGLGYDYWALGHVHTRQIVRDDPWIVYPGSLQGRHIRETGPRGCTVVTTEGGRIADVQHACVDVVRWMHVSVPLDGLAVDAVDAVTNALLSAREEHPQHPLIVRITLRGVTSAHERLHRNPQRLRAEIEAACAGIDIWIERVDILTTSISPSLPESQADGERMLDLIQALGAEFNRLERDEAALRDYGAAELERLQSMVGRYLRLEEDHKAHDPAYLRQLIPRVRELLLSRLCLDES